MCSIGGWAGKYVTPEDKRNLLLHGRQRGRDGFGVWTKGAVMRKLNPNMVELNWLLATGVDEAVFNWRAAPTTETTGNEAFLQPYDGIVHNGTVANCEKYGKFPIDSMALPYIFEDRRPEFVAENCSNIQGGFALAYAVDDGILIACNYKPVYYYADHQRFVFGSTPEMVGKPRAIKMPPYSSLFYHKGAIKIRPLPKNESSKKVLLAASAGLDSTTVAYMLKKEGYEVTLVNFAYGCNAEAVELDRITKIAKHGGFNVITMDLPRVFAGTIVEGQYNTDQKHGVRYADDWVSARNLLMMATLTSYAEAHGYNYLAYGGNLEEAGSYPDNELEFGRLFNELLNYSVQNNYPLELLQPLTNYMKHEVVKIGTELGVPYSLTWSCYGGGEKHCGKCSPCYMRKVAFERNGLVDPVEYGL